MKKYCLDTNVLIEAWNKYYSMSLCPSYWATLANLADKGIIFCTDEVKREIEKTDDGLHQWAKETPKLFREIDDEVQKQLTKILAKYPKLVDTAKNRSFADPWVIAHAIVEKAVVVTKEEPSEDKSKRIKIPDVCIALNIPWMNDFEFLSQIGIKFDSSIR